MQKETPAPSPVKYIPIVPGVSKCFEEGIRLWKGGNCGKLIKGGPKGNYFYQSNQQHAIKQLAELRWSAACFETPINPPNKSTCTNISSTKKGEYQ